MSERLPSQLNSDTVPKQVLIERSLQSGQDEARIEVWHRTGEVVQHPRTGQLYETVVSQDGELEKPVLQENLGIESQAELAESLARTRHDFGKTALSAVEIAGPQNDDFNYDRLFDPDYESGLSDAEAIEAARGDNAPESEELKREKLDYSANRLEDAARFDKDILMVISSAYEAAGVAIPADKASFIEHIRDNDQIRTGVKNYLTQKAEYYRSDLPDRPRGYGNKTPNYAGGKTDTSFNVAVEFATRMLAGEWDWKKEDGSVEHDASGKTIVGQHRDAANIILLSPGFLDRQHE